jgi:hypothetical protein
MRSMVIAINVVLHVQAEILKENHVKLEHTGNFAIFIDSTKNKRIILKFKQLALEKNLEQLLLIFYFSFFLLRH